MKKLFPFIAFLSPLVAAFAAQAYEGMAHDYQLNFQTPVTPVMEQLNNLHDHLLVLIIAISLLVLSIMLFIILRFNRKANPVPSKTTHNTKLEIIWTTIPILILVAIAIPSLRLHFYMQRPVDTELTVKVLGYQWYWHYAYPDNGGFGFDSYIKKGNDLKPGDHRQLSVDNPLVVPVNTKVRVLITGADVIHSWAVPAFGVKKDAVPGRLNETWFEAEQEGTFYGQCSQLCGVGHGFMPIVVKVVSKDEFKSWVQGQQQQAGVTPDAKPAEKDAKPEEKKAEPKAAQESPAAKADAKEAKKADAKETKKAEPQKKSEAEDKSDSDPDSE